MESNLLEEMTKEDQTEKAIWTIEDLRGGDFLLLDLSLTIRESNTDYHDPASIVAQYEKLAELLDYLQKDVESRLGFYKMINKLVDEDRIQSFKDEQGVLRFTIKH